MATVVSATTGTTAMGLPRSSGRSYCSSEAKYELRSSSSQSTVSGSRGSRSACLGVVSNKRRYGEYYLSGSALTVEVCQLTSRSQATESSHECGPGGCKRL